MSEQAINEGAVDYLIVGSGAVGLAFADTLLTEDPEASVIFVDRHAAPGGHWNDAYPFVRLHQPSAFYGVEGLELGRDAIERSGPNAGYYELAGASELLAYFERAMAQLIETGRARYFPLHDYQGEGRFVGLMSGQTHQVDVNRRTVDSSYFETSVPSTHQPRFQIAKGASFMPPGDLPSLIRRSCDIPPHFVILGGGKTAMDTGVWLLTHGVAPERITWVRPRDSWMINRRYTQPGVEFFEGTMDYQAALLRAAVGAENSDDYFLALEKDGHMLRFDPDVLPTKYFFATISEGEVEMLRWIINVVRDGHVRRIAPGHIDTRHKTHEVPEDSLFIDCTASAVADKGTFPVFEPGKITLQALVAPLVTFSASIAAYLEVHRDDDATRNALDETRRYRRMARRNAARPVGPNNRQDSGTARIDDRTGRLP